ncbi:sulfotransferase domain-containing protein, partial [Candidatus Omnitrophota bacterium]
MKNTGAEKKTGKSLGWWVRAGVLGVSHPGLISRRLWYVSRRFTADRLSSLGYYHYSYRIIFLAGMALGGTTWMKNLLARIPGYYTRSTPMPEDVAYRQDFADSAFSNVPKKGYVLFKTHLNPKKENLDCIFRNGVEKVLVTYRDLRDVAVSRYYRLIAFPKHEDAFDFVDYRALGKEKALSHSIELVAKVYIPWIREWFRMAEQDPPR